LHAFRIAALFQAGRGYDLFHAGLPMVAVFGGNLAMKRRSLGE
jgi:hypothetical protein